jgi:hypothetical protein
METGNNKPARFESKKELQRAMKEVDSYCNDVIYGRPFQLRSTSRLGGERRTEELAKSLEPELREFYISDLRTFPGSGVGESREGWRSRAMRICAPNTNKKEDRS